jgi:hypothetical protein
MISRLIGCIARLLLVVFVFAGGTLQARGSENNSADRSYTDQSAPLTCEAILHQAYTALIESCSAIGRNQVCYANAQIDASLNPDTLLFENSGDVVPVGSVQQLYTYPLDVELGTWGISLLKLQANLPETMPGQNVTFLVYGDTRIENTSGDMQAFYFSSGLGEPECEQAPRNGILVRSPNHVQVNFTVNGVQVKISSTVFLTAQPNGALTLRLIEGQAEVSTAQGTQTVQPGEVVTVALGGTNGLEGTGAPQVPQEQDVEQSLLDVLYTTQELLPQEQLLIPVDGCISAITADYALIGGYPISIAGLINDSLVVGDCLSMTGSLARGEARFVYLSTPAQVHSTASANDISAEASTGNSTPAEPFVESTLQTGVEVPTAVPNQGGAGSPSIIVTVPDLTGGVDEPSIDASISVGGQDDENLLDVEVDLGDGNLGIDIEIPSPFRR